MNQQPKPPAKPAAAAAQRIIKSSRRPQSLGSAQAGSVSLAMGEPDTGTPAAVVDAAIAALNKGRTRYAPMTGSPELRNAIAAQTTSKYGRDTNPREIILTHGGSAGLAATIIALINPGDRVLIPEPTYSLYADHVAMVGAECVWVPNHPNGSLNIEGLRQEASSASMIILCNPGNPTGRV